MQHNNEKCKNLKTYCVKLYAAKLLISFAEQRFTSDKQTDWGLTPTMDIQAKFSNVFLQAFLGTTWSHWCWKEAQGWIMYPLSCLLDGEREKLGWRARRENEKELKPPSVWMGKVRSRANKD